MEITKKQIAKATRVVTGTGFNPKRSYSLKTTDYFFEKPMLGLGVYVSKAPNVTVFIGVATNKKEFVDVVYNILNN